MKKLLFITIATVTTCIIYTNTDQKQADLFSVTSEPVTIWLEPGDILLRNKRVVFESTKENELTLTLPGNYKILSSK